MSGKPNEHNLEDVYSDFSEDEQKQPIRKGSTKSNQGSITPQSSVTIKTPSGRAFIPPPPPPTSKPTLSVGQAFPIPGQILNGNNKNQQHHMPHHLHGQGPHNQLLRQKKSTIYIKNIPKSHNKQQTLTTFFRTFGSIKSVRINDQKNSAIVRFQKQQDAYRFMQTKPLILNRSYILYDNNEDFAVPLSSINQRQKDQAGSFSQQQKDFQVLRQNSQCTIADKYRALLFLNKHQHQFPENQRTEIQKQMENCRKLKQAENTSIQLNQMLINFENNYDWTLCYKVLTKQQIDKKKIISQFNKYGPIGTISIRLTSMSTGASQPQTLVDSIQDKIAVIKIKFLGVRSSWQMYLDHYENLNLEVQGQKLKNIYISWFVQKKQAELKLKAQEDQKLKDQSNRCIQEQKIMQNVPIETKTQQNCQQMQIKQREKEQKNQVLDGLVLESSVTDKKAQNISQNLNKESLKPGVFETKNGQKNVQDENQQKIADYAPITKMQSTFQVASTPK